MLPAVYFHGNIVVSLPCTFINSIGQISLAVTIYLLKKPWQKAAKITAIGQTKKCKYPQDFNGKNVKAFIVKY